MNQHEKVNYLEFATRDIAVSKEFFAKVFGWEFEDYGPEYTAFANAGIDGGFYAADMANDASKGGALVVFYSHALEATLEKIRTSGGVISQDIFKFPGGRRFHFREPGGNEFAVWSDLDL